MAKINYRFWDFGRRKAKRNWTNAPFHSNIPRVMTKDTAKALVIIIAALGRSGVAPALGKPLASARNLRASKSPVRCQRTLLRVSVFLT